LTQTDAPANAPTATSAHAKPGTYVLVHGAWHGGWCWDAVAQILRSNGHRVFTPTLSGLGERSNLLSPQIDLQVFIQDVVDVLEQHDLSDVILVGHSFGGISIAGAADRVPQRIRQLVFLDAVVLSNGETAFSRLPPEIVFEPDQVALLERYCTPHPLKTFDDPIALTGPVGGALPKVYIQCVDPVYAPLQSSRDFVKAQQDWAWDEIATGHDAMVSAPEALAEKLMAFV
jgi:pimeloyl-ACP methyl ester carboxylesterase